MDEKSRETPRSCELSTVDENQSACTTGLRALHWIRPGTVAVFLATSLTLTAMLATVPRGARNLGVVWYPMTGDDRLNRHDIVYSYGWPIPCFENWKTHWYGFKRFPEPTDWKRRHVEQQRAELISQLKIATDDNSRERISWHLKTLSSVPFGDGWVPKWSGLLVIFAIAIGATLVGFVLAAWLRKVQENTFDARVERGHCGACGYDMRGMPQGKRCPECGAPWHGQVMKRIRLDLEPD